MGNLPDNLPGHWHTLEGAEMAQTHADKTRQQLAFGHLTDMELANRIFMVDRNSPDLVVVQTAAKERIRWLSVQLAIAQGARK